MKKATNTDVLGHVVAVSMEKLCHRRIIEMGQGSKACGLLNMSQQFVNMYSTATHSGCGVNMLWKTISSGENLTQPAQKTIVFCSGAFYTIVIKRKEQEKAKKNRKRKTIYHEKRKEKENHLINRTKQKRKKQ